ncbi:MAG: O-antigen ligase family protein [Clostridia bacterium]
MVLLKKVPINKDQWNIGLALLFIWSLIVGVINLSLPSFAASFVIFFYLCTSIFLQNYCHNESKIEKLCRQLVFFSFLSAILGIIEKIVQLYFNYNIWPIIMNYKRLPIFNDRIYSTFENPNVAGNWFAIMILIGLHFSSTTNKATAKSTKLFYQTATLFFVIALYLSGSRGAFMGLLIGLFIFFLLKGNKKDIWLFVSIFILTALVTFSPSQLLENLTGHNFDSSLDSRLGIWNGCLQMIKLKPVTGWGLTGITEHGASFMHDFYYATLYHGHNIWLTILTSLGIVGLCIYAYMKVNLFKNLRFLYTKNCPLVPMLAGIQAIIIGHGIVDFTIIAPQTGLLFIASSAITSVLAKQYHNS